MTFSLTKALMRPEPGLPEWKDRIIDGATDLPDLDVYASSDSVPIVEYVLTRDPIQLLRVARTEEAILADVRERLAADRAKAATAQPPFHFKGVPIHSMGDAAMVCGSWDAFLDRVALEAFWSIESFDPGQANRLLHSVSRIVPERDRLGLIRDLDRRVCALREERSEGRKPVAPPSFLARLFRRVA